MNEYIIPFNDLNPTDNQSRQPGCNTHTFFLANECFHEGRPGERPAVLVGDGTVDVALEEREHGKPDASSAAVLVRPRVGQCVIVQEQPSGDIEGDKNIDGVVLMSSQDEKDPKQVQHPCQSVQNVPGTWSIYEDRNTNNMLY